MSTSPVHFIPEGERSGGHFTACGIAVMHGTATTDTLHETTCGACVQAVHEDNANDLVNELNELPPVMPSPRQAVRELVETAAEALEAATLLMDNCSHIEVTSYESDLLDKATGRVQTLLQLLKR